MNKTDANCLFCKIIDGKIPAMVVYENDDVLAFLDIEPRAPGHTLIIPKHHSSNIVDLPESLVAPLFSAVKAVANLLISRLGAEGLTIGINQGQASGQVVDHLHIHLLPRFSGDGGGSVQSVVSSRQAVSLEEVQKKILGR
jgi:histidine triad (HIT) family protein